MSGRLGPGLISPDQTALPAVTIPSTITTLASYAKASLPAAGVAGRLALVTDTNHVYLDTVTKWVPIETLEAYTLAGFPAAGTAGRLARVTDDVRGLAIDLGDQWFLYNRLEIPVEWFGAKGDGATDDTTAFTNAVSALPANGGKLLLRGGGIYVVKNWTITKSNVMVQGVNGGNLNNLGPTIIRPPNGAVASDEVVKISGVGTYNVVLKDLQVRALAPNGIDRVDVPVVANGTRWILDNVTINEGGNTLAFDNKVDGVNADSTDSGGIFRSHISGKIRLASGNIRVINNYFNGVNQATAIKVEGVSAGTGSFGVVIHGNTFDSYALPIIDIGNAAVGTVRGVTISGNRFSTPSGTGRVILVGDSTNGIDGVTIVGNVFQGGGTQAYIIETIKANGVHISGNTFLGGSTASVLVTTPLGDHVITGNTSQSVEHDGFISQDLIYTGGGSGTSQPRGSMVRHGVKLTTTDATVTTMFAVTLDSGSGLLIKTRVLGLTGSGGTTTAEGYEREATFRHNATVAVLVGTVTGIHTGEDTAAADATLDVSGSLARLRVTGVAATTYNWQADVEYLRR